MIYLIFPYQSLSPRVGRAYVAQIHAIRLRSWSSSSVFLASLFASTMYLTPSTRLISRGCGIIVFVYLLFITYCSSDYESIPLVDTGVNRLDTAVNRFDTGDSCSIALASQVGMLKREYGMMLEGVTHVAVFGFPLHKY
jgi:hypothetical protein